MQSEATFRLFDLLSRGWLPGGGSAGERSCGLKTTTLTRRLLQSWSAAPRLDSAQPTRKMPRILWVLLVGIALLGLAEAQTSRPQLSGYFTFLRYRNQACEGKYGQNGTCVTEQECGAKQGTDIGRCAEGYGVCCRVSFTCNMVSSVNETEFVNPSYPSGEVGTGTCEVTITKTPDICQLRLDFLEFSLAPPDEQGLCNVDSFMVRSTVGENLPQLCGENNGQHLYVDMGRQSGNPVVLSVISRGGKRPRRWRIKISMIQCGSLDIVPPGCLQYFRSPSAIVRSFNYGPPVDSKVRYLSGLRYSICLRVEENFCSIKWETETNSSFSWGQPTYEDNVVSCRDDFITVDQGSTYGMGPGEDRFCGTRLHEKNVLISHSKPFMLKVKSNMDATANSQENQHGFSLRYTQLPCVD